MALTTTQSALANIAGQMPVRNKTIADQQRAARAMQLQQAVSSMPATAAPTTQQATQMGATIAGQAGQQAVERAAQSVEETGQLAKLGQQEAALAGAAKLGAGEAALRQERLGQVDRLAQIDAKAKTELFDRELQFKKDAADQTFFSERQLADYKRASAEQDEKYRNWANTAQNLHKRNVAVLQTMYDKLAEVERNNFRIGEQKLDQAAKMEIAQLKLDTEKRLREAQRKAANTAAVWGGAGGIMTAVGSGLILSGVGAPVGAGLVAAGGLTSAYGQQEVAKQSGRI
jgi:hypothetical protein